MKRTMMVGVEILLEPRTQIPIWISNQTLNVRVCRERVGEGRWVRSLKIQEGEASFNPVGGVDVRMPGSGVFRVAFPSEKVLKIRTYNPRGDSIKLNYYLCVQCGTLTGKVTNGNQSEKVQGREDVDFRCATCGYAWKREGI